MGSNAFSTIQWSFDKKTGVARITMDRPDALNAMSNELMDDLVSGFEALAETDAEADGVGVRVLVLEGAGNKAFSVGGDIKQIQQHGSDQFPGATGKGDEVMDAIETFPAPVIAKVDGYCLGGGFEIALSCDFRYASTDSTFGFPEINLGIFPGSSGTQRLSLYVEPNRAKELIMTGKQVSAEEMATDGVVDAVYPSSELDAAVDDFAAELAEQPPLAIRAIKDVCNVANEVGPAVGKQYVTNTWMPLLDTADHETALAAAFDDSVAEFEGK